MSDATQGVVPNATVTITNLRTNEVRAQHLRFRRLLRTRPEPVLYRLEVDAQGFKKTVVETLRSTLLRGPLST